MKTSTHVRLVGHLKFLAQAMTNPAYIRSHYNIARARVAVNKGRNYVFKYYFKEPSTGVLVPVDASDIGFAGLSSYGRPVRDTLWQHAADVCNSISVAPGEADYHELPPYDELVGCLYQVGTDPEVIKQHGDEATDPAVKERMQKMIDIAARYDELLEPASAEDIMYPYGIDIANKRYALYKTNAGLELIKALRMVKHPTVRRDLALKFSRALHDTNPDLAGVLCKIK